MSDIKTDETSASLMEENLRHSERLRVQATLLRKAARRTTRVNADVALLCERAEAMAQLILDDNR